MLASMYGNVNFKSSLFFDISTKVLKIEVGIGYSKNPFRVYQWVMKITTFDKVLEIILPRQKI